MGVAVRMIVTVPLPVRMAGPVRMMMTGTHDGKGSGAALPVKRSGQKVMLAVNRMSRPASGA